MQRSKSASRGVLFHSFLALACLFAAAIVLAACSSSSTPPSGMAKVTTTISDPATCQAPNGPYSHVWITISDVQASTSSSNTGWVDLTPALAKAPMQVDLLGQANNQCFLATLGDNLELQAGKYQQIRLILDTSSLGVTNTTDHCNGVGNCVTLTSDPNPLNPTPYPLQLSSEAQTGIKIPSGQIAGGAFTISGGQTKDLNIDFNTCESIVKQPNGKYLLKPVLHAGEVSTTSVSVNGKVVDGQSNPIAGAMVALEQKDPSVPSVDRIVQSAITATDGTWVICPVTGGDPTQPYDVVIVGSNSTGIMQAPAIVTGVSIGSTVGTVSLNLPASVPSTASTATLSGQVTSVTASNSGISMDASVSALETVNGLIYTIPLPMTTTQNLGSLWLNLQTAAQTSQNPACSPGSSYCADYSMQVPVASAYYGSWSASGATLTAPAAPFATYVVDGIAGPASDTSITPAGTIGCTPNELQTPAIVLNSGTTYPAAAPTLAFTQCQ